MDIIGIICEYNPFHNGHLYHIKKIKEKYPNSLLIAVINGYFLERGEISILSKENKTKIALENGIDIVIELPFFFGSQSADIFADAAIYLLNALKVNKIIFGSESNNIKEMENIALKQLNENFDKDIISELKLGFNYPTTLNKLLNSNIKTPNDLLGISYIKSIKKHNFDIQYESIKRTNNYHDIKSNDNIISAANIRNKIKNNIDIKNYVPKNILKLIENINENKLFELIKYKIITEDHLEQYLTVDEGIENRLKKEIYNSNNLDEFIKNVKTKRYTYNKIKRMLIHILIGLTKNNRNKIKIPTYLKILGFNKIGQKYLSDIKKDVALDFKPQKNDLVYSYELKSLEVYNIITNQKYNFDKLNKPIKK